MADWKTKQVSATNAEQTNQEMSSKERERERDRERETGRERELRETTVDYGLE